MNKKSKVYFLVVMLVVVGVGFLYKNTNVESARNQPTASAWQIKVISPNGGERFVQGVLNTIAWFGGNRVVAVGLAKPEATVDVDIASAGMIVGWINTMADSGSHLPNSSFGWNAVQVCALLFSLDPEKDCKPVAPGTYKIVVWSEDANGSMYIGNGTGATFKYTKRDLRGNWDLSDRAFTIVAQ